MIIVQAVLRCLFAVRQVVASLGFDSEIGKSVLCFGYDSSRIRNDSRTMLAAFADHLRHLVERVFSSIALAMRALQPGLASFFALLFLRLFGVQLAI